MQNLEQIPLYLNLACKLVTEAGGELTFLTGKTGPKVKVGEAQNQETQCLVNGHSIWIANNDDQNTDMMLSFLDKLGIKTLKQLRQHVDAFAARALPRHVDKVNIAGGTSKQKLLADIMLSEMKAGTRAEDVAIGADLDLSKIGSVSNKVYKLSSTNPPPTDLIVFVKGSYTGDSQSGNSVMHAEQKLLAALGKANSTMRCDVQVFGCKSPCSTCLGVLKDVSSTGRKNRNINLIFRNNRVDDMRSRYGMDSRTTTIRDLKVGDYFGAAT